MGSVKALRPTVGSRRGSEINRLSGLAGGLAAVPVVGIRTRRLASRQTSAGKRSDAFEAPPTVTPTTALRAPYGKGMNGARAGTRDYARVALDLVRNSKSTLVR